MVFASQQAVWQAVGSTPHDALPWEPAARLIEAPREVYYQLADRPFECSGAFGLQQLPQAFLTGTGTGTGTWHHVAVIGRSTVREGQQPLARIRRTESPRASRLS